MFIIITAPHNYCYNTKDQTRVCDRRVTNVVGILSMILKSHYINYKVFQSNMKRSTVDLNRKQIGFSSSWVKFHNDIKRECMLHEHIFLLDIHSFPISSFGPNTQFVILDIENKRRPELLLFREYVKKYIPSIKFKILPGAENYIQNTYYDPKHVYPLLIEVCEDTSLVPDSMISQFLTLLVRFFYYFEYY